MTLGNYFGIDVVITKIIKCLFHRPWLKPDHDKPDGSFIKPAEAMQYNIFQNDYEEIVKYDVGMKPIQDRQKR